MEIKWAHFVLLPSHKSLRVPKLLFLKLFDVYLTLTLLSGVFSQRDNSLSFKNLK